jgi:hypothetical protein
MIACGSFGCTAFRRVRRRGRSREAESMRRKISSPRAFESSKKRARSWSRATCGPFGFPSTSGPAWALSRITSSLRPTSCREAGDPSPSETKASLPFAGSIEPPFEKWFVAARSTSRRRYRRCSSPAGSRGRIGELDDLERSSASKMGKWARSTSRRRGYAASLGESVGVSIGQRMPRSGSFQAIPRSHSGA